MSVSYQNYLAWSGYSVIHSSDQPCVGTQVAEHWHYLEDNLRKDTKDDKDPVNKPDNSLASAELFSHLALFIDLLRLV